MNTKRWRVNISDKGRTFTSDYSDCTFQEKLRKKSQSQRLKMIFPRQNFAKQIKSVFSRLLSNEILLNQRAFEFWGAKWWWREKVSFQRERRDCEATVFGERNSFREMPLLVWISYDTKSFVAHISVEKQNVISLRVSFLLFTVLERFFFSFGNRLGFLY